MPPVLVAVVMGNGKPALPRDVRLELELLDEHRFGNGVVHLHYATTRPLIIDALVHGG